MSFRFSPSRRNLRTVLVAGLAVVCIQGGVSIAKWQGYRINMTSSLPLGIWRMLPLPEKIERGQIAVFCPPSTPIFIEARARGYLPNGDCPDGLAPLMKPVAAIAGDVVEQTPGGLAVNGVPIPGTAALAADGRGRPLPVQPSSRFTIGPAEVFFVSNVNKRSFDSRYFGPLPLSLIEGLATPVWLVPGSVP